MDGSRILLNAPHKVAHERYLIVCEDGSERSGVLGEDGTIELELLASGHIIFHDPSKVEN